MVTSRAPRRLGRWKMKTASQLEPFRVAGLAVKLRRLSLRFGAGLLAGGLVLGPLAQAGLIIIPTFDSSLTNDPSAATIISTINDTISLYEARFSDPIQ